jgi:hypothetical protein
MVARGCYTLAVPGRRQTGLDFAASALGRHVQALADRQQRSENGELSAVDLVSMVRAAEFLLAIECGRANMLFKAVGRRLATMTIEELRGLFAEIVTGEIEDGAESGN